MRLKTIINLILMCSLVACGCPKNGKDGAQGPAGVNGTNGTDGHDGSNGQDGQNGHDGSNGPTGQNGYNSLVALVNAAPTCPAGGVTVLSGLDFDRSDALDANEVIASQVICNGTNGTNGANGANGTNGTNGTNGSNGHNSLMSVTHVAPSCTAGGITLLSGLDANDNGSLDGLEVTSSAEICNGQNGINGTNGTNGTNAAPTAFTPVGLLNPCGDAPGIYDEVFLKLQNGTVIASFSDNANGANTRFSVLVPGSYITTDGDNCTFSIDASGNISNENHHY